MGEVLGARNPTTIREIALREELECMAMRNALSDPGGRGYYGQGRDWALQVDAWREVVAILDNAARLGQYPDDRLVPDPDPGVGAEHAPKEHP